MIKEIRTNGPWITANIPNGPYLNSYTSNVNPIPVGQLWFDPNSNAVKVFDGNSWTYMPSSLELNLSPRADEILRWAETKMAEEKKLEDLCREYPSLEKARQNFELIKSLVCNDVVEKS